MKDLTEWIKRCESCEKYGDGLDSSLAKAYKQAKSLLKVHRILIKTNKVLIKNNDDLRTELDSNTASNLKVR